MNKYIVPAPFKLTPSDHEVVIESESIGDGHHTMDELYEHRIALWCALTKIYDGYITPLNSRVKCWKSKMHSDGTMFDGWFITGMTIVEFTGKPTYITYHVPLKFWNNFNLLTLDKAPEWDGHESKDVIERLYKL